MMQMSDGMGIVTKKRCFVESIIGSYYIAPATCYHTGMQSLGDWVYCILREAESLLTF